MKTTFDPLQLDLSLLPEDQLRTFKALPVKKASKLVRQQLKRNMRKGPARSKELLDKAQALGTAIVRGEDVRHFWPDDLRECISILATFAWYLNYSAEKHLLEMNAKEMDAMEMICQKRGMSLL